MMTNKNRLLLSLIVITGTFHFFQTPNTFAQFADVSPGMSIEDALFVARNCVTQASSFKDPRTNKRKELRPQDTLGFAGITDNQRLNALRRYIVGNRQIGVQSIWAVRSSGQIAQSYLISRTALDDISSDTTIEGLANIISKNAGLPYLTLKTVAQIVSNCRNKKDKLDTNTLIRNDLGISTDSAQALPAEAQRVRDCLFSVKAQNAFYIYDSKVGITDPEGDLYAYSYYKTKEQIDDMFRQLKYRELIKEISQNARIDFSPYITAISLVINSIRRSVNGCVTSSFRIVAPCPGKTLNLDTDLQTLGIDPQTFKQNLKSATDLKVRKTSKSESSDLPDFNDLEVKPESRIWELIEMVKKALEK